MPVVPGDPWESYARTVVEIVRAGGRDLVVRSAPRGEVGAWPWDGTGPVHVLTAWDPGDERPGEEENRRRQAALEADLRRLAGRAVAGVGRRPGHGSPRGGGRGARGVAKADVVRLGGRYRQDAVFVWTPDEWTILACAGGRRVAVGMVARAPRARSVSDRPAYYYVRRSSVGGHGNTAIPTPKGSLGRSNEPPVLILTSLAGGPKHGYALDQGYREIRRSHPWPGVPVRGDRPARGERAHRARAGRQRRAPPPLPHHRSRPGRARGGGARDADAGRRGCAAAGHLGQPAGDRPAPVNAAP